MTEPLPGKFPEVVDPKDSIKALLTGSLEIIVGVFEQAGVTLPKRQYYVVGEPAVDCDQLTIHLAQAYKGLPGDDPGIVQRCNSPRTAVMVIQLWRPIPGGTGQKPPSTSIIMEASDPMTVDAWLLIDAADAIDYAGWDTGVMAQVDVLDPQGGYAGLQLTLTLPI